MLEDYRKLDALKDHVEELLFGCRFGGYRRELMRLAFPWLDPRLDVFVAQDSLGRSFVELAASKKEGYVVSADEWSAFIHCVEYLTCCTMLPISNEIDGNGRFRVVEGSSWKAYDGSINDYISPGTPTPLYHGGPI